MSSFLSYLKISKCGTTEKGLGQGEESRWEGQRRETLEVRKVENMEHSVGVNTQKNFLSPGFYKMLAALDIFGWKSLKAPVPSKAINMENCLTF